jgi:hypothetical protein
MSDDLDHFYVPPPGGPGPDTVGNAENGKERDLMEESCNRILYRASIYYNCLPTGDIKDDHKSREVSSK